MADDLGFETLSVNGGESYNTPTLDKLAKQGTRFTNVYSTPLCTPSRVQIMTGKYNFRNYKEFGLLDPSEKTFANYLQEAGYRTAIAGKWQLGGNEETPFNFGFDEYLLWQLFKGDFWYRYKNPRLYQNGKKIPEDSTKGKYGPDLFTDFINDFIKKESEKPFFIYYPMVLTHDPFQPVPGQKDFNQFDHLSVNDTSYFKKNVEYMDQMVGKIISSLEENNLLDNTILLFTGDNGTDKKVSSKFLGEWVQGDKGYTTKYGMQVPLIVYGQNPLWRGVINEDLIDFTDFLPTLLGLAGIPSEKLKGLDGRSFISNPNSKIGAATPREWIYSFYEPKWSTFPNKEHVQDKRYKLYKSGEFYDYLNDPLEKNPKPFESLNKQEKQVFSRFLFVLDSIRKN
jgi:arylsulfatase A-like enzyme